MTDKLAIFKVTVFTEKTLIGLVNGEQVTFQLGTISPSTFRAPAGFFDPGDRLLYIESADGTPLSLTRKNEVFRFSVERDAADDRPR